MPQIKAFRETNHEYLAKVINDWLRENNVTAISISVTHDAPYFHAFLVYGTNSNG